MFRCFTKLGQNLAFLAKIFQPIVSYVLKRVFFTLLKSSYTIFGAKFEFFRQFYPGYCLETLQKTSLEVIFGSW
jgi:hypothetical protein